jgi:hypothetical protein
MSSPYLLPSGEDALTGACAYDDGLCVWAGRTAYQWAPDAGWTALSEAPTTIDSGFELQSGVLAGADTHVGFLPSGAADWAGWVDLSTFSDAHPMYGDLLLCTDARTKAYTLLSITPSGLDPVSTFSADELADPVAGWSAPTNPDRLLLLGEGGLWALSAPYTASDLQHLVSFDDVDLPPAEEIPGPFQPGPATVVVPRRTRTGLRLDLSDGSGHATGLAHLPGGAALWTTYLQDDRATAARLLSVLATLPAPPRGGSLHLRDVWLRDGSVRAIATSAGLYVPGDAPDASAADLLASPLDGSVLVTWGLWLDWDDALDAACRRLCALSDPDPALVESLRVFAGAEAVRVLFDRFRSDDPPTGPDGGPAVSADALRALVAPYGEEAASLVASALTAPSVPARAAACAAAGATRADLSLDQAPDEDAAASTLWADDRSPPKDALRANTEHDHPAVRAAARDTCARLSIEAASSSPASS